MSALPVNITCIADAKAVYGEPEARGFVQVPRSLRQRCKKLTAGEWAVLMEVLDRGISWGHLEPQKIKIEDFCESSGLTKQAIADGILGLAERGILYEERTGTSKTSATCYAIIDASNPEGGPYTTPDGDLVINLLGGLVYSVNPVFLKSRKTNSNSTFQENVFLHSRKTNPKKQENVRLQSRKTKSRHPALQQGSPVPQEGITKKVIKEEKKEDISAASDEARIPSSSSVTSNSQPTQANHTAEWLLETSSTQLPFEEVPPTAELAKSEQAKQTAEAPKAPRQKTPAQLLYDVWVEEIADAGTEGSASRYFKAINGLLKKHPEVTPEHWRQCIGWCKKNWRGPNGEPFMFGIESVAEKVPAILKRINGKGANHATSQSGHGANDGTSHTGSIDPNVFLIRPKRAREENSKPLA